MLLSCVVAALHGFAKVSKGVFADVHTCSAAAQRVSARCQLSQSAFSTMSIAEASASLHHFPVLTSAFLPVFPMFPLLLVHLIAVQPDGV